LAAGAFYAEGVNSHEPNKARVVVLPGERLPGGRLPSERLLRERLPREPLWRNVVGDVLRRERLGQGRTLKDVADAARISMPYLSEVERGRKEASSEVLAAAARALGLGLADLLALTQRELARHDVAGTAVRRAGLSPVPVRHGPGPARGAAPAVEPVGAGETAALDEPVMMDGTAAMAEAVTLADAVAMADTVTVDDAVVASLVVEAETCLRQQRAARWPVSRRAELWLAA
jgi:transcriptional regulator with XRE-family HTH domain